jgi:hypothetical protein
MLLDLFKVEIEGKGPLNDHEIGYRHYPANADHVSLLRNVRGAIWRITKSEIGNLASPKETHSVSFL